MLASFFFGGGRADSWLWNSRAGMAVYLIVLGVATLLWLGFQIPTWFGWPSKHENDRPLTLGLSDLELKPDGTHVDDNLGR